MGIFSGLFKSRDKPVIAKLKRNEPLTEEDIRILEEILWSELGAKEDYKKGRQMYFVNQIVEYIVHNGVMKDLSVLQESPFTDRGSVVEIYF